MFNRDKVDTIYLACGVTDLRKSIDGLGIIVEHKFNYSNKMHYYVSVKDFTPSGSRLPLLEF